MDASVLDNLAQLGPALGSVVVIGLICWQLLKMFAEMIKTLVSLNSSMDQHTNTLASLTENVKANTTVVERMAHLIEVKL